MKDKNLENKYILGEPEPYNPNNPDHNNPDKYVLHSGGVWDHVMAAIAANPQTGNPLLNLSILFHDIGKPETYEEREGKGHTYYGHEDIGAKMIQEIGKRMTFSGDEIKALAYVAENHMKVHRFQDMKRSKILDIIQKPYWKLLKDTAKADAKSRGEKYSEEDWQQNVEEIQKTLLSSVDPDKTEKEKALAIYLNGNHIMQILELKRGGPIIGAIRDKLAPWIVDEEITDQEVIDNKIKETYAELTGDTDPLNENFVQYIKPLK